MDWFSRLAFVVKMRPKLSSANLTQRVMLRTQVRWIEIVSAKDTLIRSDKLDISRRVLVNLNVSNSVVIQTSRNPLNQQLGAMPGWLTSWKQRGTSSIWRKVRIPRSDLALLMAVRCVFGLFELALQYSSRGVRSVSTTFLPARDFFYSVIV